MFPHHLSERIVRHCDRFARRFCPVGNTVQIAGKAASATMTYIANGRETRDLHYWIQNDPHLARLCAKIVKTTASKDHAETKALNTLIGSLSHHLSETASEDPAEIVARRELLEAVVQEAGRLPPPDRDVVQSYFQGLSTEEIASKLGMSVKAVRCAVARATVMLHYRLRARGFRPADLD